MKHSNISWDDITVGQFLDLYRLSINTDLDEMGKLERAVAIIYDRTEREVEEMTMGEFTSLSSHAAQFITTAIPGKPVTTIRVGRKRYRIIYNPTKLRQRQYVEVLHFATKPIENMHLIMASIVQPVKWWGGVSRNTAEMHPSITSDMLQAPVKHVYHACVFFCKLYGNLMQGIQGYLVAEMMKKGMSLIEASNLVTASANAMGGFTVPQGSQNTKE